MSIATICTSIGRGNLGLLTGYASSSWTDYSYTFTASKTEHFLIFGFEAEFNRSWLMDNTSLIENVPPFSEILQNPDFELSNTSLPGWHQWCASYCHWGTSGQVISGSDCDVDSGNCFRSSCLGPGTDFIGQAFAANPGSNYTVSVALAVTGSGGYYNTMFYADIYWCWIQPSWRYPVPRNTLQAMCTKSFPFEFDLDCNRSCWFSHVNNENCDTAAKTSSAGKNRSELRRNLLLRTKTKSTLRSHLQIQAEIFLQSMIDEHVDHV